MEFEAEATTLGNHGSGLGQCGEEEGNGGNSSGCVRNLQLKRGIQGSAEAATNAIDEDQRKMKLAKGGGSHWDKKAVQLQVLDTKEKAKAAERSAEKKPSAKIWKLKLVITWLSDAIIRWKTTELESLCRNGVSKCRDISSACVYAAMLEKHVTIVVRYTYPHTSAFFQSLEGSYGRASDLWRGAFENVIIPATSDEEEKLEEEAGTVVARLHTQQHLLEHMNVDIRGNTVKVTMKSAITLVKHWLPYLLDVAPLKKALLKGSPCGATGCPRRTMPGEGGCCCDACDPEQTTEGQRPKASKHSELCEWRQRPSQQSLEDIKGVIREAVPVVGVRMSVQAEEANAFSATKGASEALAEAMAAASVHVIEADSVSTEGRFFQQCYGGERVGCWLCGTKAMSRWRWYAHADSCGHREKLREEVAVEGAQKGASKSEV